MNEIIQNIAKGNSKKSEMIEEITNDLIRTTLQELNKKDSERGFMLDLVNFSMKGKKLIILNSNK